MELMGTTPKNTLFLGDQIFTDIWGANRAGVQTVMLKKIDKKEEIQIVLKRIPEKFVDMEKETSKNTVKTWK